MIEAATEEVARQDASRLHVLDSFRGICALMAPLHHFRSSGHITGPVLVQNCYLFVDLFFVLSGYVIARR